jgi:hypothetical protein
MARMWKRAMFAGLVLTCTLGACQRKKATVTTATTASAPPSASAPQVDASVPPPPDAEARSDGRVTLRLAQGGEVQIAHAPGGKQSRVDVKRMAAGAGPSISAILDWSQAKVTLLIESQKSYAEMDLDQFGKFTTALERWQATNTAKSDRVADTPCELWELTDGTYRVTACLARGPLRADVGNWERAAGASLPEWAERILRDGVLPLRVTVKGPGGQTIWQQQVAEWNYGPVSPGDFEVPRGYRQVSWQKRPGHSKNPALRRPK